MTDHDQNEDETLNTFDIGLTLLSELAEIEAAQKAQSAAAVGLELLFAYVQAMMRENTKHKTKGYGLADMTWFDQIEHLKEETKEVADSVTALDSRLELGDVLGVLVHMAIFQGMDANDLAFTVLEKLKARFDEPRGNWHPAVPGTELREEIERLRADNAALHDAVLGTICDPSSQGLSEHAMGCLQAVRDLGKPEKTCQYMLVTRDNVAKVDGEIRRLGDELSAARATIARISTLFDAVAHGDDEHRAWLKQAIDDHMAGRPVDDVKGKGEREVLRATIERLERELETLHGFDVDRVLGEISRNLGGGTDTVFAKCTLIDTVRKAIEKRNAPLQVKLAAAEQRALAVERERDEAKAATSQMLELQQTLKAIVREIDGLHYNWVENSNGNLGPMSPPGTFDPLGRRVTNETTVHCSKKLTAIFGEMHKRRDEVKDKLTTAEARVRELERQLKQADAMVGRFIKVCLDAGCDDVENIEQWLTTKLSPA